MSGFIIFGIFFVVIGILMAVVKSKLKTLNNYIEQSKEQSNLYLESVNFKTDKIIYYGDIHFAVDDLNKNIYIYHPTYDKIVMKYSDVISYELIEDGQTVTKGSTGKAVIGAALFGATGAIIGSTMKKYENKCTSMKLIITINNIKNPTMIIELLGTPLNNGGFEKTSEGYINAFNFAKDVTSTLAIIKNQIEHT